MPAYYPSCAVNFTLTFDYRLTLLDPPDGATPDALTKASDKAPKPSDEPTLVRKGAPYSFVTNRLPRKCSVELPGYRQAGTFDMTFDFKDLPIDPRAIKAAAVHIYFGAIDPAAFGAGIVGGALGPGGRVSSILMPEKSNLCMAGTVDEWSVDHSDSGSTVQIRGRDFRGILIDSPMNTSPKESADFFARIQRREDIVGVVQDILALHGLFPNLQVLCNAEEWDGGVIPTPGGSATTPRHRKGADGKGKAAAASAGKGLASELSYWDLIVRECYLVGAIPYFVGVDLWIRPARAIFDQQRAGIDPRIKAPFKDGKQRTYDAEAGTPLDPGLSVRKMVYGRDIKELSFDRKFGGYQKPKCVRVISTDTDSPERGQDRTLTAEWPELTAQKLVANKVAPGGEVAQKEFVNIPVPGIRDKEQLLAIAKAVYEEIGRGELGGHCSTPCLASFGGNNADPDILSLKPGDGVEFQVDTRQLTQIAPLISTLTDNNRESFASAVKKLSDALGDDNLAKVIVATARGKIQQLQGFFRVSTVHFNWDAASGIDIKFDFQNYVVALNQVGPPVSSAAGTLQRKFVAPKAVP
jgi:hypothetical protein